MSIALSLLRRPYVELDFTRMVFDSRVSFSRSSTAARYKADKSLEFVASNAPRIDHDPATGAVRGLLVEPQATNLVIQSEDFANAAWTKVNGTVSANAATAPDGTTTADKLVASATSGVHQFYTANISGTGSVVTVSGFFKAAGNSIVQLTIGAATTQPYVNFDLAAGAVTKTGNSATASITPVGNGFYRCSITGTPTANGSWMVFLVNNDANANRGPSYTGDGTSGVYAWGAQLETGAVASSYIPTTTAAVTRAADVASFTIPERVVRLVTIYSDGTTNTETVTPGATYTIPTGTKPILRIRGYYA